jgi:hypothetical protein
MSVTTKKFRVLSDSNLYGNTKCVSYGNDVLMVDTSGIGVYLGNGTLNPKLIADNGEGKYLKLSGGEMTNDIKSNNIIPNTNNNYSLGSTTNEWKNVYATTFTGELDGNAKTATYLSKTTKFTSSTGSTTNRYVKFATISLGINNTCAGLLIVSDIYQANVFGLMQFRFSVYEDITSQSINLRWISLYGAKHEQSIIAIKTADGVFDLYFKIITTYNIPHFEFIAKNNKYITVETTTKPTYLTELPTDASIVATSTLNGTSEFAHRTPYGTCSTAGDVSEKEVVLQSGVFNKLSTGSRISVKFTNSNTVSGITLNVNNTGAKACYWNGSAISNQIRANNIYEFVYDGTYWRLVGGVVGGILYDSLYLKSSTSTGDTPSLVFQRGTTEDSYYDHKIYNSGGALKFQYSSNGIDTDILSLYNTMSKLSSGLTLTGTTDSSVASINFSRGSDTATTWNYITAPLGGNIVIAPNGISKTSTTGYHFGGTSLYPGVNNTYSLGTDSLRWSGVYSNELSAKKLIFTGTNHPHIVGNGESLTMGYDSSSQLVFIDGAIRRNSADSSITFGTSQYPWPTIFSNITKTKSIAFQGGDADKILMRVDAGNPDPDASKNYGYTLKYLGAGTGVNNALGLYVDNQKADEQLLATKWTNDGKLYSLDIIPHSNNTNSLGTSSLKWSNVYATTFTGELDGNAKTANSVPELTEEEISAIIESSFILTVGSGGSGDGIDEALVNEASLEENLEGDGNE